MTTCQNRFVTTTHKSEGMNRYGRFMEIRKKISPKSPPLGIIENSIQARGFSTSASRYLAVTTDRPSHECLRPNLCRRSWKVTQQRRGVAAVEAAVCLPVLFTVTLLFIEFSNLLFLRQSLKVASYEGIRVATKQGVSANDVAEVCRNILDSRQVTDYEISIEPEVFSLIDRGTLVTVTIDVGKGQNRMFGLLLGSGDTIEIQSYGLKE